MTGVDRASLITRLSPGDAAGLTAYGEARNQIVMGIVAVLSVLRNRLGTKHWGTTLGAVCLAPWQFSCWNDDDPNQAILWNLAKARLGGAPMPYDPPLEVCLMLGDLLASGQLKDNTGGATFYYNPMSINTPEWAVAPAVRTTVIGGHAFYKGVRI